MRQLLAAHPVLMLPSHPPVHPPTLPPAYPPAHSSPDVARVCGNSELWQLMNDASTCIKRDIVFCASLYVA